MAATLVALKEAGLPQPSSAVVFSPWAGLALSGDSLTGKADVDPALTAKGLRIRARGYLGETDPATPLAGPVFAELTGLAPLLIQVGSHEILLDDAVRLAARAAEHDVAVELQVWPQVPHVFQGFAALTSAAAFTRAHRPAGRPRTGATWTT
ncbi:alpha/beta hydrolase fold domain-containing protein [Streptomyces mirabilis]|uniref:alpha/beta hydrolase fold domain-containing protein n=1 Tax=Streptomyces mirabilis TaxID=68239 RepID=UPI00364B7D4A